jgi:hypothetical protein
LCLCPDLVHDKEHEDDLGYAGGNGEDPIGPLEEAPHPPLLRFICTNRYTFTNKNLVYEPSIKKYRRYQVILTTIIIKFALKYCAMKTW